MSGTHEFFEFQKEMVPHANTLYRRVVPGCQFIRRFHAAAGAHPLDQHFGIDGFCRDCGGAMWTFQEKFRRFDIRRKQFGQPQYRDFTLEFMNCADENKHGEYFHLAAQWYFYGWANEEKSGFDAWFFMNIPLFMSLCADFGGAIELSRALHGEDKQNKPQNSRASFLTFPAVKLRSCFLDSEGIIPAEVAADDENELVDFALSAPAQADTDEFEAGYNDYEARSIAWDDEDTANDRH